MEGETTGSPIPLEVATSQVAGLLQGFDLEGQPEPRGNYIEILVPVEKLEEVARALRDRLSYALLSMATAVDYPDRIQVIYLAFTLEHPHGVMLKSDLSREGIPD